MRVVDEEDYASHMESLGQVTIFDLDKIENGSKVKLVSLDQLPVEDQDYFREYNKDCLKTVGIVTKTIVGRDDQFRYVVDFNGNIQECYHYELELV